MLEGLGFDPSPPLEVQWRALSRLPDLASNPSILPGLPFEVQLAESREAPRTQFAFYLLVTHPGKGTVADLWALGGSSLSWGSSQIKAY